MTVGEPMPIEEARQVLMRLGIDVPEDDLPNLAAAIANHNQALKTVRALALLHAGSPEIDTQPSFDPRWK